MQKLILILTLSGGCVWADQFQPFNPVYNYEMIPGVDPIWSPALKARLSLIRVKIFPHNSKYNSPQGRDNNWTNFRIRSAGLCQVYNSETATSEGGLTRKYPVRSGSNLDFDLANVTQALWLECAQSFQLVRPDYPDRPISYEGHLFIRRVDPLKGAAYLTAVNVLPFEQYLKGVVPSEMPSSWSLESLKAQAIAARTYAYHELASNVADQDENLLIEQSGAQLDDTVTYQAYLGLKNAATTSNRAVDLTAGQVMIFNNRIIKAYFHADSGGHTENAENVWGTFYPYIVGKPEIYPDGVIPGTQWSYSTSLNKLQSELQSVGLIVPGSTLVDISIASSELYPSGRAQFVNLKFADGLFKKISGVDFAFAVRLKSNWIQLTPVRNGSVTIQGRGFGHGAGMNQYGARHMIERMNKSFDETLKFYYSSIDIAI